MKVTVPVGVVGVVEVSLTLAVQDETVPKTRDEEAQETVMIVEWMPRAVTVRGSHGLVAPLLLASPL